MVHVRSSVGVLPSLCTLLSNIRSELCAMLSLFIFASCISRGSSYYPDEPRRAKRF